MGVALVDVAPADDVDQVLVPAGTLLNGGPDSLDQPQTYRTDRDIVVGRAQIEKLAAVYVGKRITGKTKRKFKPNIQRVRALVDGVPQRIKVCTRCLKSGRVTKPFSGAAASAK